MKRICILICLLIPVFSFAQTDFSEKLQKELVKIENGKYVVTDYAFLTFKNGDTKQLEVIASCPVDIIHRDNFINIYSSLSTMLMLSIFKETGVEMPDVKELDELIGDPDMKMNLVMAKNGLQIQLTVNGEKNNATMKWSDLFAD